VLADEIVFSGVAGRVAFARRDGVPVSPSSTAPARPFPQLPNRCCDVRGRFGGHGSGVRLGDRRSAIDRHRSELSS
jgi:hypothetical protein